MWENILGFVISCSILILAGSLVIKSLSKIAAFLRMSEYVVGFIILAVATSLPELFVGISASINKYPSIILGTVIGSNIANLTIIIGIPILLAKGIVIQSKKTTRDAYWMTGLTILPLILMLIGGRISRIDGVILISAFILYMYKLLKEKKRFKKKVENHISHKAAVAYITIFIVSMVLLYLSSDFVVNYAKLLAIDFSIPAIFIGLFMVAIGTSLPELVSGITAVMRGHQEMGVGNIIGSVIANSTLVLGVAALIFPITSEFLFFITSISFMILVSIIFTAFAEEANEITWLEGTALVLLYVFFLIVEFYLKGFAG